MTFNTRAARQGLVMRAMQASIQVRSDAGLDLHRPICVYDLCQRLGVTVRFNDISSMEGMYDRTPRPRIHVSALRPLNRRAFTCGHELGHHVFGHGSTIDELHDELSDRSLSADELLAESFAAFLLMPTVGLRGAFASRGIKPESASARDIYAIASTFGVGYATLVNHLALAAGMLSWGRRLALLKFTPKMIREEILGNPVAGGLVLAHDYWTAATLETETGSHVVLPRLAQVEGSSLESRGEIPLGSLYRASTPGVCRVIVPNSTWAILVRVCQAGYTGLAEYRHLPEEADD
jgi:hypothetical protein